MKEPVCPYNYLQANFGLSREESECLFVKNTREGIWELLDISHDEYKKIDSQLQELIDKSENLLHAIESDRDVAGKRWWLDQRAQLAEVIEDAKKR
jgi:hypothetical protein